MAATWKARKDSWLSDEALPGKVPSHGEGISGAGTACANVRGGRLGSFLCGGTGLEVYRGLQVPCLGCQGRILHHLQPREGPEGGHRD